MRNFLYSLKVERVSRDWVGVFEKKKPFARLTPPQGKKAWYLLRIRKAISLDFFMNISYTQKMETPTISGTVLRRRDVLAMEPQLSEFFGRIISFTAHGLYFPQDAASTEAVWIAREHKLLIPLIHHDTFLGVFIANGVVAKEAKKVLPLLPPLVSLCLDAVLLYKQSRTDSLTGLARREELLERMAQDAGLVRTRLSHVPDAPDSPDAPYADNVGAVPLYRACMGLVLVRLNNMDEVARSHGYGLADSLLQSLGQALQAHVPHEVLAARTGDNECTLLVPAATRTACQKMAESVLEALDTVLVPHPLTHQRIRPRVSVGHALYPQDMEGGEFSLPMEEQSRLLLHKARLAALVAAQRAAATGIDSADAANRTWQAMSFGRILPEGGLVLENQAMGRVRLSLGRNTGARDGLRFAVWALNAAMPNPLFKGEVVLVDVRETDSIAECLHLADPAWPLEAGDSLHLLAEESPAVIAKTASKTFGKNSPKASHPANHKGKKNSPTAIAQHLAPDSATGFLRHSDFLHALERECEAHATFGLALLRINPPPLAVDTDAMTLAAHLEDHLTTSAALCREAIQAAHIHPHTSPAPHASQDTKPWLGGRFGGNSLVFFHPAGSCASLHSLYADICATLTQRGIEAAVGLAAYPYLKFRKGEILECCQKALDFALLLPEEKVGVFGSLALNISADKRYSQGDVFGAVEEYKLALLADATNAMAWNSLGVCMAALTRHNEARRYFKQALKHSPNDGATLYNLGVVCQNLGEQRAAARHFRACIKADPQHIFGHIRLGQMAERRGKLQDARELHSRAAALEDAHGGGSALARRHLARVALRQRKGQEARELLHEALVRNPQDALAMQMLASIYLDGGEDPSMAEMLARQSVGLHPSNKQTWLLLGRALQALGHEKDAQAAVACAEKL